MNLVYNYKATLMAALLSVATFVCWIFGAFNMGFLLSALLLTIGCWILELLVSRSTIDILNKKD